MSDYIPFDIQASIMKYLPSKSLIQFRTVSKAWKSLIDSFEFIADHHRHTHQRHNHLLVSDYRHGYTSIVDDDTFPRHKFPLTCPLIRPMYARRFQWILGSSQGLFCFYSNYSEPSCYRTGTAAIWDPAIAIWNPAIRKLVDIGQLPQVDENMFKVTVGFGVCPHTLDPKIVIIPIPWVLILTTGQVEVFRLSLGAWTSQSIHVPREFEIIGNQVAIDRFIYWPALHISAKLLINVGVIMSFDLTTEEFTYINLPDVLEPKLADEWGIYKLKESLVVLQSYDDGEDHDVWIMENGVQKSFKKIYTIKVHLSAVFNNVLEFRNSGEPIVSISDDYDEDCEPPDLPDEKVRLYVYEHNSRHFSHIEFFAKQDTFQVSSYSEFGNTAFT